MMFTCHNVSCKLRTMMIISNWRGYSLKGRSHGQVDPKPFSHVQALLLHVYGKPPLKAMQQGREHEMNHARSQHPPRTHPSPGPKGQELEVSALKSTSFSRNLSGINFFGSGHTMPSCPMAHTFTRRRVPLGIVYPRTCVVLSATCGRRNGAGGWSRKVSFTMAWRYLSCPMSDSSTCSLEPITWSSSSRALDMHDGFSSSSAIAHSTVAELVSVPALNKS